MGQFISSDAPFNATDSQSECAALGEVEPFVPTLISRYFETLNAENVQATAQLFAEDGVLYPPFEAAIVGREAIAHYLETEAKGLKLFPRTYTVGGQESDTKKDANTVQYRVIGSVQTPLFSVNVGWTIGIKGTEIASVRVKLLAALEELLKLKPEGHSAIRMEAEG